jgi:hypothetical protein
MLSSLIARFAFGFRTLEETDLSLCQAPPSCVLWVLGIGFVHIPASAQGQDVLFILLGLPVQLVK